MHLSMCICIICNKLISWLTGIVTAKLIEFSYQFNFVSSVLYSSDLILCEFYLFLNIKIFYGRKQLTSNKRNNCRNKSQSFAMIKKSFF